MDRNSTKVGMIGIGLMGHGIARNLVSKGWTLQFFNRPGNQPVQDLIELGATAVEDLRTLAAANDVIILCVTGTPEVESILLGDEGVLSAIRPGTTIIDCSTAVPASTEAIARAVDALGSRFIDAAMTRTPLEAEQGRLNLLVGAELAVLDEIRPLLDTFAENVFHAGPVGAGHKLKLLHNFVSLGCVALISEAAACAQKGGISAEILVDALAKGGGYGAALDRVSPFLLEGDPSRLKFVVRNAFKDLNYYHTMAEGQGCQRHVAEGLQAAFGSLMDAGLGDAYVSTLSEQFAKL